MCIDIPTILKCPLPINKRQIIYFHSLKLIGISFTANKKNNALVGVNLHLLWIRNLSGEWVSY